jgi:cell division protein FtsL
MVQTGYQYANNWEAPAPHQELPRVKRVKKTYRKVSKGKLLVKLGMAAFVYGLVLVFLCLKASTLGYQIVQLESDIHHLESSNQRLQYEIEKQVSLDYVEQYAVTKLGMYKPEQNIKVAKNDASGSTAAVSAPVTVSANGDKTLHKIYASLVQLAEHSH